MKHDKQLSLIDELEEKEKAEEPYFNGLGEPLPWETEEYLAKEKTKNDTR